MIVYLSGPYTSGDIDENILNARKIAVELWERGYAVICPHLNTANFEKDTNLKYEDYIVGDLEIVSKCDIIIMIPKWEESPGALVEREYAEAIGVEVYYYPEIPVILDSDKGKLRAKTFYDEWRKNEATNR